ncbi:MAG TPA: Hsp20 family protein [Candidatus Acidoferrales bacterium]|jgi:HSP20 family protein
MTAQSATGTQIAKTSAITRLNETENVFDRMQQAYGAIERRAFEIFENNGRWFGNDLSHWLQAESEFLHPLHLEIEEANEALTVRAEVPGFTAKELEIQVQGNRLTISGKHESKEENTKGKSIYSERCANEIFRSIELPSDVDGTKVNATLKNGVLNIDLPKAPHTKSVRIEPKSVS